MEGIKQVPISLSTILGVTFIVLKLCKVIDWSWWWVLCPFWGPIAIVLAIIIIVIIILLIKISIGKNEN